MANKNSQQLMVTVAPISPNYGLFGAEAPCALIKLVDPATPPNEAVLMQGYQLTNAEARLACELTKGGGHDELASRMGLSPNT
ncbi:hypothetical protein ABTN40_19715, partial [Acinetobacter baumannii]